MNPGSSVDIAKGYGLVGRASIIGRGAQTGSGAHPASYLMGTGDCLPGGKAARARS
jgi:hypothetical protein